MDTQGIIATVGTILLFGLIAFLVGWLQRKGILGTDYERPRHPDYVNWEGRIDARPTYRGTMRDIR